MADRTLPQEKADTDGSMLFPSLQKEMNQLFDQFRAGFPFSEDLAPANFRAGVFPAIDVVDNDDVVEVSAEVPGVKEDDLDVSISGEVLTLKGEKSYDREEKEDNYHRMERQYGSFRRQIPLGFAPESGATEAEFADGILKLRIKKPATVKSDVQKIDIKKK